MRVLILLSIFWMCSSYAWAQTNAQLMFDDANTLLEERNFLDALNAYRDIEKTGEVSGSLFLNMGIVSVEIDSLGLAKYYFLKALDFEATFAEANEALTYVDSQFSRKSAILPKLPWDRVIDSLIKGVGAVHVFIWGFIMICLSVLIIIVNWFYPLALPKKNSMFIFIVSLSMLTIMLAFYLDYVDHRYKEGIIIAKEVPVTTQPSEEADILGIAYEGYAITIDTFASEKSEGWYYIRLGNGQFGWIQPQGSKIL